MTVPFLPPQCLAHGSELSLILLPLYYLFLFVWPIVLFLLKSAALVAYYVVGILVLFYLSKRRNKHIHGPHDGTYPFPSPISGKKRMIQAVIQLAVL